jgi:hypothetical protein
MILPGNNRLEWAFNKYFIKDLPFSLRKYPYLVEIYKDEATNIIIEKSSQCGGTEWMMVDAFYCCDRYSAKVAYYFPYEKDGWDFSKDRINKAIEMSSYLTKIVTTNSVGLKHIRKGSLYIRGTDRKRAVVSIPIDVLMRDEEDLMNVDMMPLTEKRLGASDLKLRRIISNPSVPGVGIDKHYLISDKRKWHIKCDRCGYWQVPTFLDNIDLSKKQFVCSKCKRSINRLMNGEWIAEFSSKEVHGYQISRLFNPNSTIEELIVESLLTSESEIQTFWNFTLGLPRSPKGAQFNRDMILACREQDYQLPNFCDEITTAGIDIGNLIHIRISRLLNTKRKAVYIGAVKHKDDLYAVLKRFNANTIVVDALPETRFAKDLADEFRGKVHIAYYNEQRNLFKEGSVDGYDSVNIDRVQMPDLVLAEYQNRENILPTNIDSIPDYIKHVLAMSRVLIKDKNNNDVPYWMSNGADHYFHAEVYDRTAVALRKNKKRIIMR